MSGLNEATIADLIYRAVSEIHTEECMDAEDSPLFSAMIKAVLFLDPDHSLANKRAAEFEVDVNNLGTSEDISKSIYDKSIEFAECGLLNNISHLMAFLTAAVAINPLNYAAQTRLVKATIRTDGENVALSLVETLLKKDNYSADSMLLAGNYFRYIGDSNSAYDWMDGALRKATEAGNDPLIEEIHSYREAIVIDISRGKCKPVEKPEDPSAPEP